MYVDLTLALKKGNTKCFLKLLTLLISLSRVKSKNPKAKDALIFTYYYCPSCFATSSAKFSSFFSIPSPVSNLTNRFTLTLNPTSLDT